MTVAHRRVREVVATPPRVVIVVVVSMIPCTIFSRIVHEARRRASESTEPLSPPIDRCECIDRYFSPSSRRARSRFSPFVSPRIDRSIRVAGGRDARKIRSGFLYPNPPTIRDSSRNVHPRSHNRIHRSVDRWIDGSIANTAPSIAGKEKKTDRIDRSMKTPIESNR